MHAMVSFVGGAVAHVLESMAARTTQRLPRDQVWDQVWEQVGVPATAPDRLSGVVAQAVAEAVARNNERS